MSHKQQSSGPLRQSLRKVNNLYIRFYANFLRSIDRLLSRKTTKTSARLSHHAIGQAAVVRARRRSGYTHDGPRELRWKSDEDDFKHLGQPYDQSLIDDISEKFETILENKNYTYTQEHDGEIYGMGVKSADFDIAENLPEIGELLTDDIRHLIQGYYGSYFKPMRINVYRNHHVPSQIVENSEVYSNYWHCDDRTTDHFKLFVTLSDVTEDDGPFHVISKSDTQRVISNGYNRRKEGVSNEFVEENAEVQKFTGSAGSAAVCNTELQLHRAGTPADGHHRDMVMISFVPSSEPLRDDWIQHPEIYSHECENGIRRLFSY